MFSAGDKVAYDGCMWTIKYMNTPEEAKLHKPTPKGNSTEALVNVGLLATELPRKPKVIPLGERLLAGESLPVLTAEEEPMYTEMLTQWDKVESVRVLAPGRLENDAKALFNRLGVLYPSDWRGTEHGKRKVDAQEQRTLAATIKLKDGRSFNNLSITLRLLSEGKEDGWKITKHV